MKKNKSKFITFILLIFFILIALIITGVAIKKTQTTSGNAAGPYRQYKPLKRIPTRTLE